MSLTLSGGSIAAGDLETTTDTDISPFVKVELLASQGTGSTPFFFELSADLLLRD
jgi:hypothetical protein